MQLFASTVTSREYTHSFGYALLLSYITHFRIHKKVKKFKLVHSLDNI